MLEALVFVESAGDPNVIVGRGSRRTPRGSRRSSPKTGQSLLGMNINLARSRQLTRQDRRRPRRRVRTGARRGWSAERARIDERFDPRQALAATVRYLKIAESHFGRRDLAFESYHMGIGNLQTRARRLRRRRTRCPTCSCTSTPRPTTTLERLQPALRLRRRLLAVLLARAGRRAGHAPVPDRPCGAGPADLPPDRRRLERVRPAPARRRATRSRTPDALDHGYADADDPAAALERGARWGSRYDPGIGSLRPQLRVSPALYRGPAARRPSIS